LLFWDVMWHRLVVVYRRFGAAFQYHLQRVNQPKKNALCKISGFHH